jgi:Bacteriophage HK97-gp10, putative tail-component
VTSVSFHSRIPEAEAAIKKAVVSAQRTTAVAVLAEAKRRVRVKSGQVRDSLEIVEGAGGTLKVGSKGSHGGRPIALFLEEGTAHTHAQPFLKPAAEVGRGILKAEATANVRAAAGHS